MIEDLKNRTKDKIRAIEKDILQISTRLHVLQKKGDGKIFLVMETSDRNSMTRGKNGITEYDRIYFLRVKVTNRNVLKEKLALKYITLKIKRDKDFAIHHDYIFACLTVLSDLIKLRADIITKYVQACSIIAAIDDNYSNQYKDYVNFINNIDLFIKSEVQK